jgi:hypothetical protein
MAAPLATTGKASPAGVTFPNLPSRQFALKANAFATKAL